MTLANLVIEFLAWTVLNRKPATAKRYKGFLTSFVALYKLLAVAELKRIHCEKWQQAHPNWKQNTRSASLCCVLSCLRWGVEYELIDRNPLEGKLKIPTTTSRGKECLITKEEFLLISANTNPSYRELLYALYFTGTRPETVRKVEGRNYNKASGTWIMDDWKCSRFGQPLTVHLTPEMVQLTERLIHKYPTGPLFRNTRGQPWTADNIVFNFYLLRKRLGLRKGISMYSMRHTFATELLQSGVSDALVAKLLGHKSTIMLWKHYAHLLCGSKVLHDALSQRKNNEEEKGKEEGKGNPSQEEKGTT